MGLTEAKLNPVKYGLSHEEVETEESQKIGLAEESDEATPRRVCGGYMIYS
jgi:hypothetical protein